MTVEAPRVRPDLAVHERLLWGLCYRMTGSAADADDLVQDTFVRALEKPPSGELRPWLVKVALNLARDRLRARRRQHYKGPWLPTPISTDAADMLEFELASFDPEKGYGMSPSRRYEFVESLSIAFLLALEALTPRQRAVVLLCDVFDNSVSEAALALNLTESNVKVVHHRARKALADYDTNRAPRGRDVADATRAALTAFLTALAEGDEVAARALLVDDAIALNDRGTYRAAGIPLVGAARVARAFIGIAKHKAETTRVLWLTLNGAPALYIEQSSHDPNVAPVVTMHADLDASGKIRRLYSVLASDKLERVKSAAALA